MIAGLADSLINFRGPLLEALKDAGCEVHVAAPGLPAGSKERGRLEEMGLRVHSIPLRRTGTSVSSDLKTILALWLLMLRIRPTHVLGYTIKPVVYGSLAAWLARVPNRFALVTGLGYSFQGGGERRGLRNLVEALYRMALGRVQAVFFQNPDDAALFRERGLVEADLPVHVVNGSGIDVDCFVPVPLPAGAPRFLLIARLLGDKGVREYAAAACRLRALHPEVRCFTVGWIDENPDAISQSELDGWIAEGAIEHMGRLSDVRPAIAECSVYVLPSYREGTPRTVLEAMAMGRPVITTDAPGCRETVTEGVNGFKVPVKSAEALEDAMRRFVADPLLGTRMGADSRRIAEEKYDVRKVNAVMLRVMGIR